MLQWFYLHGLASSPESRKAQLLGDRLREQGQVLHRLDLNDGGFSQLTVSRQIRQVSAQIAQEDKVALIGSSLGGLTAAWVAQESLTVERVVLLAPAFGFPDCWLTAAELQHWQESGHRAIYHYGEGRSLPLHYHFVEDARTWPAHVNARELGSPVSLERGRKATRRL